MISLIFVLQNTYKDLNATYFKANHKYQIRALEIPMLCDELGTITRLLNATHAGLGFIDMNDSSELVFEYTTDPDYVFNPIDFLRPHSIFNESTGLFDFIWDASVTILVQDKIKTGKCGWEKNIIVASGISGIILDTCLFSGSKNSSTHIQCKKCGILITQSVLMISMETNATISSGGVCNPCKTNVYAPVLSTLELATYMNILIIIQQTFFRSQL
ncbi:Conserved_hypothetical protein [Hexamita inflata]|uniref:Uncharacterized protein n=1 Tax=Hexamita inflata TaxID=28002 RepID=A0AA86QSC7_9EUKA|nr:Conserved hypothetical protein [Hexamita inflata]